MRNLSFDAAAMESDAQLRRLLLNSDAVRGIDLVVEEFCLPGKRSCADVAVVNEEISAFKVVAGRTWLDRLPRQIQEYDRLFRYSSIVTVPSHLPQIEEMAPPHWGIWVALGEGRTLRLRCLRQASVNLRRDGAWVARLLTEDECITKLNALISGPDVSGLSHKALVRRVGRSLTLRELDRYLCECTHARAAKSEGWIERDQPIDSGAVDLGTLDRQEDELIFSLRHLAHSGLPVAGSSGHVPMVVVVRRRLPDEPAPVNLKARARLQRLRAEFADAASKQAGRITQAEPGPGGFRVLSFYPWNSLRN